MEVLSLRVGSRGSFSASLEEMKDKDAPVSNNIKHAKLSTEKVPVKYLTWKKNDTYELIIT